MGMRVVVVCFPGLRLNVGRIRTFIVPFWFPNVPTPGPLPSPWQKKKSALSHIVIKRIKMAAVFSHLMFFSTPGSSSIFPFGTNRLLQMSLSVAGLSGHREPLTLSHSLGGRKREWVLEGEALKGLPLGRICSSIT